MNDRLGELIREWKVTVEQRVLAHLPAGAVLLERLSPGTSLCRWAFAQGVLSALWSIEDGAAANDRHSGLALARAIQPLLG